MDIVFLKPDEIIVECEVRGLRDTSTKEVSETMKQSLERRLEEESNNTRWIPEKAHEAACKQPQQEAEQCLKKIQSIHQLAKEKMDAEISITEWYAEAQTKWLHVKGRIYRSSGSITFKKLAVGLTKGMDELQQIFQGIKSNQLSLTEGKDRLNKLIIALPQASGRQKSRVTRAGPAVPSSDDSDEEILGVPSKISLRYNNEGFAEQLDKLTLGEVIPQSDPQANSTRASHHKEPSLNSKGSISDSKLRREVSTWKVRFEGERGTLTIERFLARIEWHADRAQIPLDSLVGVLDLCLEGVALDWFWLSVDRNPESGWESLKQGMLLRFEVTHNEDELQHLLSNRKQRYPHENFQQYYQAIHRISLNSSKVLSDNTLYTILRRNMRPGLQMALHQEWEFKNLAAFARRCSSLEDMWRRFGHNPEAGLQPIDYTKEPFNYSREYKSRPRVRFDQRPHIAEVNEYSHVEETDTEENPAYEQGDSSYYQQVCAINEELKHRSFQQNYTSSNTRGSAIRTCFNCGDPSHTFMRCRKPNRGIFCYGCGARNVFLPDCGDCNQEGNGRYGMKKPRDTHLGYSVPNQTPNLSTEETASNTDPELYRRFRN